MLMIFYRLFAVIFGAVLVDYFNTGRVAGVFYDANITAERTGLTHTVWVDTEIDFTNTKVIKLTGDKVTSAIIVAVETSVFDGFIDCNNAI